MDEMTVTWKDEDEVNDVPVGPMFVSGEVGGEPIRLASQTWTTKRVARGFAAKLGASFEED